MAERQDTSDAGDDAQASAGAPSHPETKDRVTAAGSGGGAELPTVGDEVRTLADGSPVSRWAGRRREKILDEIERNRRGEYKIPTWVLVVVLVVFVAGWAFLVIVA